MNRSFSLKSGLLGVVLALRSSFIVAVLALTVIATGCQKKTSPRAYEEQYLLHTIAYQGETYTIISAWYTGSGQNWRELAAANPEVRPNRLRPGSMIRIPRVLLTRETALPKSFVDAATSKLKAMPPEKGMEEPTSVVAPVNPASESPKATPPVFEEPPVLNQPETQPDAPVALPVLPDPDVQPAPTAEPLPVVESPSSAPAVSEPVKDEPVQNEPIKVVEPEQPKAPVATAAPAKPNTDDHQKTRDQLLKELLQDY